MTVWFQPARAAETTAVKRWDRGIVFNRWETLQVSEETVWERIATGNPWLLICSYITVLFSIGELISICQFFPSKDERISFAKWSKYHCNHEIYSSVGCKEAHGCLSARN